MEEGFLFKTEWGPRKEEEEVDTPGEISLETGAN